MLGTGRQRNAGCEIGGSVFGDDDGDGELAGVGE
jgi:hypothetical protein